MQDKIPEEKERGFSPAPAESLYPSEENLPSRSSGIDIAKGILIAAITSLVIVFLMNSFIMPIVGRNTYQADITRLEKDLVAMQGAEKGLSDRITAQDSRIATATEKSNSTANSLANYANKADLNNQNAQIQSAVSAASQAQTTAVNVKSEFQAKLDAQAALIKTLQDDITALQKTVTTTTTATGSTTASANVTTMLSGITVTIRSTASTFYNPWLVPAVGTSSSQLYFLVCANTTDQVGFSMSITNNTGKPVTNLALQFGLRVMMSDYTVPAFLIEGNSVTIGGFDMPWTRQSALSANPTYFVTGTTIWAFPVPIGISQYQGSITTDFRGTGNVGQQIILQPAIQILGISQ